MLELLSCPRGHFWERPGEDAPPAVCPECGAPAETLPLLDLAPQPLQPPVVAPLAEPALFDSRGFPFVAGYEILEELGRAPTGVRRYSARQMVVRRMVLLEVVIAREDPSQKAWGSLRGEAAALGKLSHPNIVHLHDAGERDRQFFFNVREQVDGPTLAEKVADKLLPFRQIIRLMELLARAVDEAHERGVLHRNLKPSSVLLQPVAFAQDSPAAADPPSAGCMLHSGCYIPRLTDFGLARRAVEGDPVDAALYGDEVGFLSPEQAWGRAKDLSPTTDVYGLGAILYFLLTGRPPHGVRLARGEHGPGVESVPDVLDAIQTADLPPLGRRVPADLAALCRKCLARQPRRRYSSAGALADDLRRAALGLPLACRPVGAAARLGKWLRRRPAFAGMLAVAVLGVAGTLAGYLAGVEAGEEHPSAPVQPPQPVIPGPRAELAALRQQLALSQEREAFAGYLQHLARAEMELALNNPVAARALLDRCLPRFRGVEWRWLRDRAAGRTAVRLANLQGVASIAFQPRNGRILAVASSAPGRFPGTRRGVVHLHEVHSLREVARLDNFFGPVHVVCFSPTGEKLATGGGNATDVSGQVRLWNVGQGPDRGEQLWSQDLNRRTTGLAYSPDGAAVVAAGETGLLTMVNAHNGALLAQFSRDVFVAQGRPMSTQVRYSPDGSRLVSFNTTSPTLDVWIPSLHQIEQRLSGLGPVQDVAVSARWLAVARSDNSIHLQERRPGGRWVRLGVSSRPVRRLAFSGNGARLAVATEEGDRGTLRVWALEGEQVHELVRIPGVGTHGLAFDAEGKRLAGAGPQEVVVWGARVN